jgi:glycosyltransferase involved in cell wall biosynthesis
VQAPYSRGKSFGKILSYLDAEVPVIASDEVDHSLFFDGGSGVVSNDAAVWTDAVVRLLSEPQARDAMAAQATRKMIGQLTLQAAVNKVEATLRKALDG